MIEGMPVLSRRSLVLLSLTAAPVSTLLAARPVWAQDGEMSDVLLTIAPVGDDAVIGYFSLTMDAGTERVLEVRISNMGTDSATARTFAADAYTLPNGGFNGRLEGEEITGPTTWLDYPTQVIDLDGQTEQIVSFRVSVPEDTPAGQYLTCLVVQSDDPTEGSGGIAIDQVIRQVIAVAIDVPGVFSPAMTFQSAVYDDDSGIGRLDIQMTNTGNVHVRGGADIRLSDGSGVEIERFELALGTLYAGLPATIEVAVGDALSPGAYSVTLTITDDELSYTVTSDPLELEVAVPATPDVATPVPPPVEISEITAEEVRSDGVLQLVAIAVTVDNQGPPIDSARLTLRVERDGDLVEDVVLGDDVSFPGGTSSFSQRYLPLDGWQTGSYLFTAILDLVDPSTGEVQTLSTRVADARVVVS